MHYSLFDCMLLRFTPLPIRFWAGPNRADGTHGVGEDPNRTFSDSVRLWGVSYRPVELNSFKLTDLPHLSHTQLARVVRHSFSGIHSLWQP